MAGFNAVGAALSRAMTPRVSTRAPKVSLSGGTSLPKARQVSISKISRLGGGQYNLTSFYK